MFSHDPGGVIASKQHSRSAGVYRWSVRMARVGLSFSDRSEISTASKAGWSVRRIARHLGRCPSVFSR